MVREKENMAKENDKIRYFSEKISKNKEKNSHNEDNKFNCLFDELNENDKNLVNDYISTFKDFYDKNYNSEKNYKFYQTNEIISRYFDMINDGKIPLFDREEDAIRVAKFIMNPSLDTRDNVFININKVITKKGLFYTLSFNNIPERKEDSDEFIEPFILENFLCNEDMYYTFNVLEAISSLIYAIQEGKITETDMKKFIKQERDNNEK